MSTCIQKLFKTNQLYTKKIDCFSFGVNVVQTLTREFPKPENQMMTVNDPHYPQGALNLCVLEIEQQQNHIGQVDPNYPLLPIALDCLKDNDREYSSAQQLCERVAALKETLKYKITSDRESEGKQWYGWRISTHSSNRYNCS